MTAMLKYQRLEATALWRPSGLDGAQSQRRDVIISIGQASLVVSDLKDQALAHWSLAALERANPGQTPAIYHPSGDPDETLEIPDHEAEMIEAIETLRAAVSRGQSRPGRLRLLGMVVSVSAVVAGAVFWLPDAAREHTLKVVPEVKHHEIAQHIIEKSQRWTGPRCSETFAKDAINALQSRFDLSHVVVLPDATAEATILPGRTLVLNRRALEGHEDPHVLGGHIIAAKVQATAVEPLEDVLRHVGLRATLALLTTGSLPEDAVSDYAETLARRPMPNAPTDALLAGFAQDTLSARPYALAQDPTGQTTRALIQGDAYANGHDRAVLGDGEWVTMQSMCQE